MYKIKRTLDDEKIKKTRTPEGYKFLGFGLRLRTGNNMMFVVFTKRKLEKIPTPEIARKTRTLKRAIVKNLTVEPDRERILKRLKADKYCDEKYRRKARAARLIYKNYEAVQRFKYVIRELFHQDAPCKNLVRLQRISCRL